MHAGGQALLPYDPAEQLDEVLALLGRQAAGQVVLVALRHLHEAADQLPPGRRDVQGARPAVVGVGPPLDEPALLEVVDQPYHPACSDVEGPAERLLRPPFVGGHEPQDHHELRIDAERRKPLLPEPGAVKPELGQQEGRTWDPQPVGVGTPGRRHSRTISSTKSLYA